MRYQQPDSSTAADRRLEKIPQREIPTSNFGWGSVRPPTASQASLSTMQPSYSVSQMLGPEQLPNFETPDYSGQLAQFQSALLSQQSQLQNQLAQQAQQANQTPTTPKPTPRKPVKTFDPWLMAYGGGISAAGAAPAMPTNSGGGGSGVGTSATAPATGGTSQGGASPFRGPDGRLPGSTLGRDSNGYMGSNSGSSLASNPFRGY